MEDRVKQVIIVRKDLKMKKGKIAAQVAHASLGAVLSRCAVQEGMFVDRFGIVGAFSMSDPMPIWLQGSFFKVVVGVDSEEEILAIQKLAEESDIVNKLITDAGHTVFNGVPTITTLALGPDFSSKLDPITGNLSLL